jgi:predicted kinase
MGISSILDLGLLRADHRQRVAETALAAGQTVQLHFIDVEASERWRQVSARNTEKGETFRLTVTREMFDFVETIWQPPGTGEMAAFEGVRVGTA